MHRFLILGGALFSAALVNGTASAQYRTTTMLDWTGFYVGAQIGYGWQPRDPDEHFTFDRDGDGRYGDLFPNYTFGHCGGTPTSNTPLSGCIKDGDGTAWKIHAGYDHQFGERSGPVIGLVAELGEANLSDDVGAFGTIYRIRATIKTIGSLRARAGYSFGTGTLVYGTGGLAFGRIRNSFATSVKTPGQFVQAFVTSDPTRHAWGYNYGGGIEQLAGPFSVGALYLFTTLENDKYRVTAIPVGGGRPLDFKRSSPRFGYHSALATVSYRF